MVNNDLSIANESVIFSKKNISYKFDLWKTGKENILFITGLSGGGKTTLANNIADKYNGVVIELDLFQFNRFVYNDYKLTPEEFLPDKHKIIKKYFDMTYGGKKDFSGISDKIFFDEFIKFARWLIYEEIPSDGRKFIIEGLQIAGILLSYAPEILEDRPCIIVGTSIIKSIYQRYKRDGRKYLFDGRNFYELIKWYFSRDKNLNKYKRKISSYENIEKYLNKFYID